MPSLLGKLVVFILTGRPLGYPLVQRRRSRRSQGGGIRRCGKKRDPSLGQHSQFGCRQLKEIQLQSVSECRARYVFLCEKMGYLSAKVGDENEASAHQHRSSRSLDWSPNDRSNFLRDKKLPSLNQILDLRRIRRYHTASRSNSLLGELALREQNLREEAASRRKRLSCLVGKCLAYGIGAYSHLRNCVGVNISPIDGIITHTTSGQ